GTAAIQLAHENNLACYVSAGTTAKIQGCLALGAAGAINYREEDTFQRVLEMTENKGVDVILDWIGASHLNRNLEVLRPKGRLVVIGLMGGNKGEIHMAPLLSKRISIIGSILRSQSTEEKALITVAFKERALPLLRSGRVRPIIDRVFPIQSVEEAHRTLQEGDHFGKIVLTWQ
ncbi:MAG: zinc-binding dehydrogenase, partial [Syntrophobacteraceae bacterium]|nr:zinc-binding dehydrogenase [Syntrophobacteraceae bacterium]